MGLIETRHTQALARTATVIQKKKKKLFSSIASLKVFVDTYMGL